MKLVNAKLYEDQIKKKMFEVWYDEKYQYYFGGSQRRDFSIPNNSNDGLCRAFAVLNDKNDLLGVIRYYVDFEAKVAQWFGAINFTDDKITFGRALFQVITDCFIKFGLEVVEWNVICGNPIERSYDRLCNKFGGRIVGIRHKRAMDLSGNIHDEKIYEILREDFLKVQVKDDKYVL